MVDASAEEVMGKVGRVTARVRGAERAGEVVVPIRGGTETYLAYSDEEIAVGSAVLVIRSRGGRSVDVTWFSG